MFSFVNRRLAEGVPYQMVVLDFVVKEGFTTRTRRGNEMTAFTHTTEFKSKSLNLHFRRDRRAVVVNELASGGRRRVRVSNCN